MKKMWFTKKLDSYSDNIENYLNRLSYNGVTGENIKLISNKFMGTLIYYYHTSKL